MAFAVLWGMGGEARALGETTREQKITLRQGWNAVSLEVEPLERRPGELFTGTPVEVVAAFFPQVHPVTYIQNPGDAPWREEGWRVWYAPRREDGFLANLHTIRGNQAYLIYASAGFDWNVRGAVSVRSIHWQPNSYNFTGFQVDPQSPPTFQEFFAPSSAHRGQRIYQLVDGIWSPVRDVSAARMQVGAAYWVYCEGGSSYQGPVELRLSAGEELNLGSVSRDGRIELHNASAQPTRLVVESMSGPAPLPLAYLQQDLANLRTTFPPLPGRLELPALPARSSQFLRLAAVREQMTTTRQSTLLRITNGEGVVLWLPVVAERAP